MSTSSDEAVAPDVRFRALRQFNDPQLRDLARARRRIGGATLACFPSERLGDRLVRALGARHALPVKEVLESFEFFERVRSEVRAPLIVDLLAGHGLVGALFAVFEPQVEQIRLLDRRRPDNFDAVLAAVAEVAPYAVARISYEEVDLRTMGPHALPEGCGVVAVHACGGRTDRCLEQAVAARARVAVMPCCYPTPKEAPPAIVQALGPPTATDVDRTYRLRAAGYTVRWLSIPACITPMNRILLAEPA